MMAPRKTFLAIAKVLSAEGASRRVLLGRGVLFMLLPALFPVMLALGENGAAMLFPGAATTDWPVSRGGEVIQDWMMIAYCGLGLSSELAGLSFFIKLRKNFDMAFVAAVLAAMLAVHFVLMLFVVGTFGVVDLIWPGARFWI